MLSKRLAPSATVVRNVLRKQPLLAAVRHESRSFASQDMTQYAYNTPGFHKFKREDLADKWGELGFSIRPLNGHVRYTWTNGSWDKGVFVPAPYQLMHINAGALHYGVSAFEGMKAFGCKDGKIRLMNPELNAMRMQKGADALLMPQVPKELFVNAVKESVRRNKEFVPPYGHNASLYIRPLLFASGQMLGLAPLANEYTFFVTVLPAGGYFGKGNEVGVKAFVSSDHDRSPKGLGQRESSRKLCSGFGPCAQGSRFGLQHHFVLGRQGAEVRGGVLSLQLCRHHQGWSICDPSVRYDSGVYDQHHASATCKGPWHDRREQTY